MKGVIVKIVNVKEVVAIVPNKAAKDRKRERRRKNEWLTKYGRTAKQIARWKRRNKGQTIGDGRKRW